MRGKTWLIGLVSVMILSSTVQAGPPACDSGSDGSDGVFNPQTNITVDLRLAIPGDALTTPGTGSGVYDAARWVLCFKYTSINIPAGVTVTFDENHASGAPVVWLSQNDVVIDGSIILDGDPGNAVTVLGSFAKPGPGGFEGGRRGTGQSNSSSAGIGPGGGFPCGDVINSPRGPGGGGFGLSGTVGSCALGGPPYGSPGLRLLIGGSGGGASSSASPAACDSGAGGGAIAIVSSTQVMISSTGAIRARGGNGGGATYGAGGSGGAIRISANLVTMNGSLSAVGGTGWLSGQGNVQSSGSGGPGRIRIDANQLAGTGTSNPNYTTGDICYPAFPSPSSPTLRIVSVDGQPVASDPTAGILTFDVSINSAAMVPVVVEGMNIPVPTTVSIIVVPARGPKTTVPATLQGKMAFSTATAQIPAGALVPGRTELQVRAAW